MRTLDSRERDEAARTTRHVVRKHARSAKLSQARG